MKLSTGIISGAPIVTDSEELDDTCVDVEWRTVCVSAAQHGTRLDRALTDGVPEFSRNYLQQLIDAGLVTVNGRIVHKASSRVGVGDALVIELKPTPQSQAFKPQAMPLEVVFQDDDIAESILNTCKVNHGVTDAAHGGSRWGGVVRPQVGSPCLQDGVKTHLEAAGDAGKFHG